MQRYEYKVVPAPNQTRKVKGVKTSAGRFAVVLTEAINEEAARGWEYVRSDSLPVEEKPGLLKAKVENYYTVLVFRRAVDTDAGEARPVKPAPAVAAPVAATPASDSERGPTLSKPASGDDFPSDPPLSKTRRQDPDTAADNAAEDDGDDEGPFAEPSDTDREVIR